MTHQELREMAGSLSEETLEVILDITCPNGWQELSSEQRMKAASLVKKSFQGKESAS